MKTLAKFFFVITVLTPSAVLYAGGLEMRNGPGDYSYGKVDSNGRVEMRDSGGNYSYGKVDSNGRVEMRDSGGNYSYGRMR